MFSENELELLISGMPKISSSDFLSNIKWIGFTPEDKEVYIYTHINIYTHIYTHICMESLIVYVML